ncbi:hypothetical protein [Mesorhizobium jarvisii]|uniref:hypothetical protein n=1 Tax=Mesorhizobium jarvisii TaxID=1777867 RepID=UPI001F0A9E19|nr:hypothetical protein [Mesorhizobium jarvisii]MCH4558252.1 hypothetical protein [Mesorhizobium jarvisii]
MNVFFDRFSTGQIVVATGVPNATLQSWLHRGYPVGKGEGQIVGGGSPGRHRQFTFRNAIEIALAKELLEAGIGNVESAFQAASSFAHIGKVDGNRMLRVPGCPFWSGGMSATTLLACSGDSYHVHHYRSGKDVLPEIWHALNSKSMTVIDAHEVFDRVAQSLGYDPAAVMRFAYGISS